MFRICLLAIFLIPVFCLFVLLPILLIIDHWRSSEKSGARIFWTVVLVLTFPYGPYLYGIMHSDKQAYKLWSGLGGLIVLYGVFTQSIALTSANRHILRVLDKLESSDFSHLSYIVDSDIKDDLEILREELQGGWFQKDKKVKAATLIMTLSVYTFGKDELTHEEYNMWSDQVLKRRELAADELQEHLERLTRE